MLPKDFVHLHVHSDASDGVGTIETLVSRAEELGMTALALTDHGTLANMVSFFVACRKHNIKPIFGQEIYFAIPKPDGQAAIHHMTVLAQNKTGLSNLFKLTTIGSRSAFRKPAVMLSDLIRHNEGLIILSGCQASPFYALPEEQADALASELKIHFKDRIFMELMFVSSTDTHTIPLRLAERWKIKTVMTTDVHFARKEDSDIHKLISSARFGYSYDSTMLWLKSVNEMQEAARSIEMDESVLRQSAAIADMIDDIDISRAPSLPNIECAYETIKTKVLARLKEMRTLYSRDEMQIRINRIQTEMKVICDMGYINYFYIVDDIVSWAKAHDIRVGPGRGSGAGSYLLYLLGVTQVDPFEFGMSFERFLNTKRKDMPDVDIDFEMDKRDLVIKYAEDHWKGVPIATYSRYSHKSLVHDLAKLCGVPKEIELKAAEDENSDEFAEVCGSYPVFGRAYNLALGQIRHRGKHASGIVITDQEVPLERAGDYFTVPWTEGEHKELSTVGVVKFDILGLSALSALKRMERLSGRTSTRFGRDDLVLRSYREGDLLGIFQFSGSAGIKRLTMKVSPTSGNDLIAINALYRPGALDVGSADAYPGWKKSPRKIHPKIDPLLKSTFGAIVYQEQVMSIFALITGGSLDDADIARRVIVKSKVGDPDWERSVTEIRDRFMAGGESQGFEKKLLLELWTELMSHARYSFNISHAACYTHISYAMSWHKVYTPLEFYAAMMEYDCENLSSYLYEAASRGYQIIPPHVNYSTTRYEIGPNAITLPLSNTKFLGDKGVEEIINARKLKGGAFETYEEFSKAVSKRGVNQRARLSLYALGAFDGLKGDLKALGIAPASLSEVDEITSKRLRQRIYMGLSIPTKELAQSIKRLQKECEKDEVIGFVAAVVEKQKERGTIWSVYLQPDGFVWVPEKPDLIPGDAVVVKKRGAKGVEIRRL